jgi:hypothetical protein
MVVILAAGDVMDMGRVIWISLLAAGLFTLVEVLSGPDREDAEIDVLVLEPVS